LETSIERYDPFEPPDAAEWLELDWSIRIELAEHYHEDAGIDLPDGRGHAMLHAVIENLATLGDETPMREKPWQLMAQGLDRHDALHAIMWALTRALSVQMCDEQSAEDGASSHYHSVLRRLNARVAALQMSGDLPPGGRQLQQRSGDGHARKSGRTARAIHAVAPCRRALRHRAAQPKQPIGCPGEPYGPADPDRPAR
jgi:hypothetical protein